MGYFTNLLAISNEKSVSTKAVKARLVSRACTYQKLRNKGLVPHLLLQKPCILRSIDCTPCTKTCSIRLRERQLVSYSYTYWKQQNVNYLASYIVFYWGPALVSYVTMHVITSWYAYPCKNWSVIFMHSFIPNCHRNHTKFGWLNGCNSYILSILIFSLLHYPTRDLLRRPRLVEQGVTIFTILYNSTYFIAICSTSS